jgi:hypothetical protein
MRRNQKTALAASQHPDLEFDDDAAFHRGMVKIERAGWVVFAGVLLAALVGLFGGGPASDAEASSADGSFALEYERYVRQLAPQRLIVRLGPPAGHDGSVDVALNADYLEHCRLKQVQPTPTTVVLGPNEQVFRFAAGQINRSATVVFHLEPEHMGRLQLSVRVDGGTLLQVTQFVYP